MYKECLHFSKSHVWMWELDHKEGWASKNSCSWIVVLEKTLKSPLDYQEIKPVNLKGNQSWIYIGKPEAEAPILWPTWCKEPTQWKRPWCWESLRAGGEEGNRGWDGWMVSQTQWIWIWANSGRWWRTRKPGITKSQTQLSDWTELNQGSNLGPLHWELRVLATGPPGKSHDAFFF